MEREQIKINGLLFNIIAFILLIFLTVFILFLKLKWMDESYSLDNLEYDIQWFLLILIGGIVLHEMIKYFIYLLFGIKKIKIKINSVFYLYNEKELSIKQAKILWLIPFIIIFIITMIFIIWFNVIIALAASYLLLAVTDDIVMYYYLRRFDNKDTFIQEEDHLGFQCIKNN